MNKVKKTEGQLIAKLQYMKSSMNGNTIQHIKHNDIDMICDYLKELKDLKAIIQKHGLENLTNHELDCAIKRMLGYVQENNRLMNQLIEWQRLAKQKQEQIEELNRVLSRVSTQENSNPPLKFEELEENNWYWDNKDKEWCKYISYSTFEYLDGYGSEFEENRFYRYEVKEVK